LALLWSLFRWRSVIAIMILRAASELITDGTRLAQRSTRRQAGWDKLWMVAGVSAAALSLIMRSGTSDGADHGTKFMIGGNLGA